MKKIFLLISTAVISAIVFNSCSTTGVSLTKRHYRSGYNLEISSAETKPAHKNQSNNIQPEAAPAAVSLATDEPQYASVADEGEKSYIEHKPFSLNADDNSKTNSEAAKTETGNNKKFFQNVTKVSSTLTKALGVKKVIHKTFKRADDERSLGGLIWTLAGILLVVWLISLLTGGWGLGNFLHIFLVLALILILLRLLHVI